MAKTGIKIEGEKWNTKHRVRADRTDELYKDIPEGKTLMTIDNFVWSTGRMKARP